MFSLKNFLSWSFLKAAHAEWDREWDDTICMKELGDKTKVKYVLMIACDSAKIDNKFQDSGSAVKIARQLEGIFDVQKPSYFFVPTDEERSKFGKSIVAAIAEGKRPEKFFKHPYIDPEVCYCPSSASECLRNDVYVDGAGVESFIANRLGVPSERDDNLSISVVMASSGVLQYMIGRLLQVPRCSYEQITVEDRSLSALKIEQNGNVILSQLSSVSHLDDRRV